MSGNSSFGKALMQLKQERPVNTIFLLVLITSGFDLLFRSGLAIGQAASGVMNVLIFTLYVVISVYAAFGVFRSDDPSENIKNFSWYLVLSGVAFFATPISAFVWVKFPGVGIHMALSIFTLILTQIWFWYLGLTHGDRLFVIFRWIFWLYFLFLILSSIYQNEAFIARLGETEFGGQGRGQQQLLTDLYTQSKTTAVKLFTGAKLETERQQNRTRQLLYGDPYAAEVDRKAKIENIIELKKFKAMQTEYRDIDAIFTYAELSSETLGVFEPDQIEKETRDVTISCTATNDGLRGKKRSFPAVDVQPGTTVSLEPFQVVGVQCEWAPGIFKTPVTKQVFLNMTISYPFTTSSYWQHYWMDQTKYRDYFGRGKDPLEDVTEKTPKTVFTKGPLEIGLHMLGTKNVFALDPAAAEADIIYRVTLKNVGKGKVRSLDSVIVFVPKGLRMDSISGQASVPEQVTCDDKRIEDPSCDDTLSNIYHITPTGVAVNPELTLLFTLKTTNPALLISPTSLINGRLFKATAHYTYTQAKVTTVKIRPTTSTTTVTTTPVQQLPTTIVGAPAATAGTNTATITYTTSVPTKDKLVYYSLGVGGGFVDQLETDHGTKMATTDHRVLLAGLTPNTQYKYKIVSTNSQGEIAENQKESYSFTTTSP